ncbi:NUDIX hydrolase [Parabacteroides sp. FAFU027]|uniref:NUDIX hydrolase n=1 Tax=Parabacteroides sp. FAFU027 TaxID=2922715 RepID=UPI001FAF0E99|nr:NUDIX domain-containing protein [Parabacteroides sp. FAFU027]
MSTNPGFFPHLSVDCVLLGYDGEKLNVLLVEYGSELDTEKFNSQKLPGSVIYDNEDVDDAAERVLYELTGIKNIYMKQFKCFANPDRTKNPRDKYWLENAIRQKIGRIITVGYLALLRIDKKGPQLSKEHNATWCPLDELQSLAFDHNLIIEDAVKQVRKEIEMEPAVLFELLPRKFTALELRTLFDMVHGVKADVRNFHKKIAAMEYVVPLEERQSNVSHRAARYYRFDKKIYNKIHG